MASTFTIIPAESIFAELLEGLILSIFVLLICFVDGTMLGVELIVAISDNCSDSLLSESLRIISGNSDGDADGIHNADCDSFDGRILRITVGVGCTEENMFGASEANEGDVANGISGCWVPEPSIEFDGVVDEMPGVKSGSVTTKRSTHINRFCKHE